LAQRTRLFLSPEGIPFVESSKITNIKSQISNNDRNSKIQTMSPSGRFWSRAAQALAPRVEYWNLRFIWDLVLVICDFRPKTAKAEPFIFDMAQRSSFQCKNKVV
jgi:hypothetical protein